MQLFKRHRQESMPEDRDRERVLQVACPECGAEIGERCIRPLASRKHEQHQRRWIIYRRAVKFGDLDE